MPQDRSLLSPIAIIFSLFIIFPAFAHAQERTLPSREDIKQWIATNLDTPPLFREGDVLTQADLDKLRPFVPPGYIDEFNFVGVEFHVSPSGNYTPHQDYLTATEKYADQPSLADDGALEGYVAGRPFAQTQIRADDSLSGYRAAWNYNHRWKFYGMDVQRYLVALLAKGTGVPSPPPGFPADLLQGGGKIERYVIARFQQAYHTHLAQLANNNYRLPLADAEDFEAKFSLEYLDPYDVRGEQFLIYRYNDPQKMDDSWTYAPSLRKVRRFSPKERDDPIVGTDMTIDDFTGFSGRVLEHRWKFLGWKTILHVMNSRHPYARFYGPQGWLPNDRWELRPCAVVEQIPIGTRNYASKIFFWDAQTYETALVLMFDRQGKLWKVNDLLHGWSEDSTQSPVDRGKRLPRNIGSTIIDLHKAQATVFSAYTIVYPELTSSEVVDRYDINRLTEGGR